MGQEDPVAQGIAEAARHGGWFIALITGTWGIVLRALIGRHQRITADQQQTLKDIQTTLYDIAGRVTWIEGRMAERDRTDRQRINRPHGRP